VTSRMELDLERERVEANMRAELASLDVFEVGRQILAAGQLGDSHPLRELLRIALERYHAASDAALEATLEVLQARTLARRQR